MERGEEKGSRRPNPIDVHVGSRVRLQRMLLGVSQERLGERLGLTFQQIQKYEKGVNRIGASRLFDLGPSAGRPDTIFLRRRACTVLTCRSGKVWESAPRMDTSSIF